MTCWVGSSIWGLIISCFFFSWVFGRNTSCLLGVDSQQWQQRTLSTAEGLLRRRWAPRCVSCLYCFAGLIDGDQWLALKRFCWPVERMLMLNRLTLVTWLRHVYFAESSKYTAPFNTPSAINTLRRIYRAPLQLFQQSLCISVETQLRQKYEVAIVFLRIRRGRRRATLIRSQRGGDSILTYRFFAIFPAIRFALLPFLFMGSCLTASTQTGGGYFLRGESQNTPSK